jgi:threonine/homoserine/homoserine lactone efflux protein
MLPALVGFAFGFIGSVPVAGPIALLVFAYGMQGRGRQAVLLSVGGAIAEAAYAYMAFWGLGRVLERYPVVVANSRGVGAIVLVVLGAYFILRKGSVHAEESDEPKRRGYKRSFFLGFTITALNPTLIVTWTAAATTLFSTHLLPPSAPPLPFAVGVFGGIVAWFATLAALLHRYRSRIGPSTLDRLVRGVGVVLVGVGLWFAWGAVRYYLG